jgi:predicted transcriptional regulator
VEQPAHRPAALDAAECREKAAREIRLEQEIREAQAEDDGIEEGPAFASAGEQVRGQGPLQEQVEVPE